MKTNEQAKPITDLCRHLLLHACFSNHTSKRTGTEILEAAAFFFDEATIREATPNSMEMEEKP